MNTYYPDVWVILKITYGSNEVVRKVLAGWFGGYAGSNSWKLSSGIEDIKDMGDHYKISNYSGSTYICYKEVQRLNSVTSMMYESWSKEIKESGIDSTISIEQI